MTEQPDLDRLLPLTATVFHVLVALAREPRHGYAVAREVASMRSGAGTTS